MLEASIARCKMLPLLLIRVFSFLFKIHNDFNYFITREKAWGLGAELSGTTLLKSARHWVHHFLQGRKEFMNAFMLAGFKTATNKWKKLKSCTGKINTATNTMTMYLSPARSTLGFLPTRGERETQPDQWVAKWKELAECSDPAGAQHARGGRRAFPTQNCFTDVQDSIEGTFIDRQCPPTAIFKEQMQQRINFLNP